MAARYLVIFCVCCITTQQVEGKRKIGRGQATKSSSQVSAVFDEIAHSAALRGWALSPGGTLRANDWPAALQGAPINVGWGRLDG